MEENPPEIWTVGHSTRSADDFVHLLTSHGITVLADVRRFPASRRYPHFNAKPLQDRLGASGIAYHPFPELGGRRTPRPDSSNTAWRNASFRGYADYMETEEFSSGIQRLLHVARSGHTAIMCAEAVWWRCHRGLIADYLKASGILVHHITGPGQSAPHPFTPAARLIDGRLSYRETE